LITENSNAVSELKKQSQQVRTLIKNPNLNERKLLAENTKSERKLVSKRKTAH
jgi:hypothetical protein